VVEADPDAALDIAVGWYGHPAWEVRSVAVSMMGSMAGREGRALAFLRDACGADTAWQVNEVLAMAFDDYCASVGYEEALPTIEECLAAPSPNVRRAVSEGLRPWTAKRRAYFASHPEAVIKLLGRLRDDESRYVQESVGNALRDVSRKHFPVVLQAVRGWVRERPDARSRRVIARFALRNAVKDDPTLRAVYE
jgi:3-methyladenine DNA glycosylase AlkC